MKKALIIISALTVILTANFAFCGTKWDDLLVESARVFEDMTSMPEEGIPESLVKSSYAICIFPSTISGGFVIGAEYGQGVILKRDEKTKKWSAPAVFNIVGGSFGWQIGGQATDNILLVMSERGAEGLLQSQFKLGGDAAISAGPVGRNAEASTDAQLKGGILSYSRSRGLFVGAKLEGAVISFNSEGSDELYGKSLTAREILMENKVKTPSSGDRLIKSLNKY